jgi:hypothetical protein
MEAYNERDMEGFIALCDPRVEFHSAFAAVGGAVYHGHDGLQSWSADLVELWGDEIRVEPEAFFDLGEHTLAYYVMYGRGQYSGVEVALRELSVSEDALEPIAP